MTADPSPPPRHTGLKLVFGGAGVALAGLGAYAILMPRPTPDIAYRVLTVDLSRGDQAVVTFEVEKDPATTAECQVAAFNDAEGDLRESWRLDGVLIGPSATGERRTRHTVAVPTRSQAAGAAIAQCVIRRSG